MLLCKYKNMFGKPKEGVHSVRFMNFAIVDVIITLLFAYFIHKKFNYSFKKTSIILFIIGMIAHYIFCVETALNKILFNF